LDALVAYQLALGRQEDFHLETLELKSALASNGRALFLDTGVIGEPGHKNCNACHFNAGGTAGVAGNPQIPGFPVLDGSPRGFNMTAATNVNETSLALSLQLPRDGGFGVLPLPTGGFGNFFFIPGFGDFPAEDFNSTTLVEAADTSPFFHNHTVKTLEDAVAFYGTAAFQTGALSIGSPGGPIPVKISSDPNDP
jgi:cytochrome c peroxidase